MQKNDKPDDNKQNEQKIATLITRLHNSDCCFFKENRFLSMSFLEDVLQNSLPLNTRYSRIHQFVVTKSCYLRMSFELS